jgi:hypothetical protein
MAFKFDNIADLYRSFETVDVLGSQKQASLSGVEGATEDMFTALRNILLQNNDKVLNGAEIFANLKELAGKDEEKSRTLAKLFRVYTTNVGDKNGNSGAESIAQWYKDNGRPSAYTYLDSNGEYVMGNFDLMIPKLAGDSTEIPYPELTYLLVDAPNIDLKLRNADKAETFLNYVPGIIASQLVPYLSAEFTLHRNNDKNTTATNRPLMTMSPLKFLLGADTSTIPDKNKPLTANAMIYDAMTRNNFFNSTGIEKVNWVKRQNAQLKQQYQFQLRLYEIKKKKDRNAKPPSEPKLLSEVSNTTPDPKPSGAFTTVTGMEMFTMPQTLINVDYDQTASPRYHPVINPMLPFGTITDFSVNVQSSVGTFSFKTAKMTLKIFDRSRLVEIADFISPKLYKSTTIWVTYGWRAPALPADDPSQDNPYFRFINETMLKREAYGVINSSIQIDSNGVATVTLSLSSQGGNEVIISSPDAISNSFDVFQQKLAADISRIQELAARLGLPAIYAAAPDIRGSVLMSSVNSGNLSTADTKTLNAEIAGLTNALNSSKSGDAATKQEFLGLLKKLYSPANNAETELAKQANATSAERFSELAKAKDFFAVVKDAKKQDAKKFANDKPALTKHPLLDIMNNSPGQRDYSETAEALVYGDYGTNSFGKVFAVYFAAMARAMAGNVVDEFQVIFYKLNHRAGKARGLNIAEFPIDVPTLKSAYAKRVKQQKGDRMSFSSFMEIVRESQFGDMKNRAYGFSDQYKVDKTNGTLVAKDEKANTTISKLAIDNWGADGPFLLPMVDFYIETLSKGSQHSTTDLLEKYTIAANESDGRFKARGQTRIMRIHIYDRAATPHQTAETYMKAASGLGYVAVENDIGQQTGTRVVSDENSAQMKANAGQLDAAKAEIGDLKNKTGLTAQQTLAEAESSINKRFPGANVKFKARFIKPRGEDGKSAPSFEVIKREISRLVPTLNVGSNGTMISNVNYSTNQDALLSTIMMLRNTSDAANPSEPNGSGAGDLPMRVVQGTMSLTTMGCPILEYMQQFFIDLNTGTTVDNLYNVISLNHNMSPGKFTTELKLAFADAYGTFEGAQSVVDGLTTQLSTVTAGINAQAARNAQKK